MKVKTVLIVGTLLALLSMVACTMRSHTEPELTINNALNLGQAIYVNQSMERPNGIEEIHINQGDTAKLVLSTDLLRTPSYQWTPENTNVVKFIHDTEDPEVFYAIALADSGATTKAELNDAGNMAVREFDIIIEKQWADPAYFRYIGVLNGHTYYISLNKRTWVQAEVICREAGGHLATIQDGEENSFLLEGMAPEENAWIGCRMELRNIDGEDKWNTYEWITGEPIEFRMFSGSTNNPDIFFEIYWHMDVNGAWQSWHEISYAYFLEME